MEYDGKEKKEQKWKQYNIRQEKERTNTINASKGIIATLSIIALSIGLIFVLLNNDFNFSNLMHRILESNYAIFDIETLIRDIHGLLPDNVGFFTAIEDLAVIVVSIVYVVGWFINILFAVLT